MPVNPNEYQDIYGSKYLEAADLQGKRVRVFIEDVNSVNFNDNTRKLVLSFRNANKQMVLNKTNAQRLEQEWGAEPNNWIGRPVELFGEKVMYQGKQVLGLRLWPIQPRRDAAPIEGFPPDALTPAPHPAPQAFVPGVVTAPQAQPGFAQQGFAPVQQPAYQQPAPQSVQQHQVQPTPADQSLSGEMGGDFVPF